MDILTKNNIDRQNFSLFIRDLSETLQTNLKHVIEDTVKDDTKNKKTQRGKKQPVKKKADIVQNNKMLLEKKLIEDDFDKIIYLHSTTDLDNPFVNFKHLKTEKGIEKYKFLLLNDYWSHKQKNKYLKYILTLYFSLKDSHK